MSSFDPTTLTASVKARLAQKKPQDKNAVPTIEMVREMIAMTSALEKPFIRADIEHTKSDFPVSGEVSSVQVDIYRPKNTDKKILPVLVYLPGGGFNAGAVDGHHHFAAEVAARADCTVFLVNYSLSPEVKFPVALYQCYDVLNYIADPQNASKLNVDPSCIAVGGDSAGGNITAAVSLLAKQRRGQANELKNSIKYQVMYYPLADLSYDSESQKLFEKDYFPQKSLSDILYFNYAPNKEDWSNILLSPLRATTEELAGLPPALIITAEADPIRDGGEAYAGKLRQAGVDCSSIRMNGVTHGYTVVPVVLNSTETEMTLELTVGRLRKAFTQ